MVQAEAGIEKLADIVDSLIVIPNERLKLLTDKKITFLNAFQEADDVLLKGVRSICELITVEGVINLDFADVCAVMANAGLAHMGVGNAKGKDKAEMAAKMAMSSPLLETNISGARGIVVNITASPDIGLDEIDNAVAMITSEAQPDATIIFGAALDPSMEDEMKITLVATGFVADKKNADKKRTMPATESKAADVANEVTEDTDIKDIIEMLNRGRK
jgi:cell division protein FtsZ